MLALRAAPGRRRLVVLGIARHGVVQVHKGPARIVLEGAASQRTPRRAAAAARPRTAARTAAAATAAAAAVAALRRPMTPPCARAPETSNKHLAVHLTCDPIWPGGASDEPASKPCNDDDDVAMHEPAIPAPLETGAGSSSSSDKTRTLETQMPMSSNCGLKNLGNTCYISAVVQLIAGQADLVRAIQAAVGPESPPLARRFVELLNVMCATAERTILSLQTLRDAIFKEDSKWTLEPYNAVKGQQQSADEFLTFLCDVIPGLATAVNFKERTLPNGVWTSGSTTLTVGLAPGTKKSLTALLHAQYAGSDGLNPVVLGALPSMMIITIKRWRSNQDGHVAKDNTEFGISEPLQIFDQYGSCIGEYTAVGFINHTGNLPTNGHYTTTSKRGDRWLRFDDMKPVAYEECGDAAQVFAQVCYPPQLSLHPYLTLTRPPPHTQGGQTSYVLLYKRTSDGGGALISEAITDQVTLVKEAFRQQRNGDEWERAPLELVVKAREIAGAIKQLQSSMPEYAAAATAAMVKKLMSEFGCSDSTAHRAIDTALSSTELVVLPPPPPSNIGGPIISSELSLINPLPMWNDRVNWTVNAHIPDRNLVYQLVCQLVASHAIYRELLSYCLNDPDYLIFIQRPEQSGKTFTCTLLAWLGNLCYGQCAYVLLRTGSGASEDYEKYGGTVNELNKMIWEAMVGYTPEGHGSACTYHKLPHSSAMLKHRTYEERIYKGDFFNTPAREGFMQPFLLHSFDLRNDKELKSETACRVLTNKYPIVFSRLCTASNISRAVSHEMDTMINAYGVDEDGFAKMTLLNDEYQMNVKEGTRTQEELHEPLASKSVLFDVVASAIEVDSNPQATNEDKTRELDRRFQYWEEKDPEKRDGIRSTRAAFSALLRGQVRISATTVSGQVTSEDLDLRMVAPIVLMVDDKYYGHPTSAGIDPTKAMRIEWRGSSSLEFIEAGDYPGLMPAPPKACIQKFIMDEARRPLLLCSCLLTSVPCLV